MICQRTSLAPTVTVEIEKNTFTPATITVSVGAVIRWTNLDNPPHDATLLSGECGTATLNTGDSGSLRFLVPGTYGYYCTIHPSMRGTIVVQG